MGNRSYLKFSTGHIGKNGDIDGIVKTYEYNNGLAIIWMMLFDQADIIEIGFDCNNGLTKNFPIFEANKKSVIGKIEKSKKIIIDRYGDIGQKAIDQIRSDLNDSNVLYISLNLVEYYMFGFDNMTDMDVALELISGSENNDYEYLEEISGYESLKNDANYYSLIGEKY